MSFGCSFWCGGSLFILKNHGILKIEARRPTTKLRKVYIVSGFLKLVGGTSRSLNKNLIVTNFLYFSYVVACIL